MACVPSNNSDQPGRPPSLTRALSAWRKLGSLATHWAHSEDSVQTGQRPWLIWVFAERTLILLVLSWGGCYDELGIVGCQMVYIKTSLSSILPVFSLYFPLDKLLHFFLAFLAHLSRRLTSFKLECLWSQLASLDQILCVAFLGVGKGCKMV